MGADSNSWESLNELVDVVERYGAQAAADDGYDYKWLRVEEIVSRLSFADPAPTSSMIKSRATKADKELCTGDDDIGWCYGRAWPEIGIAPDEAVVFVCADVAWSHVDAWN